MSNQTNERFIENHVEQFDAWKREGRSDQCTRIIKRLRDHGFDDAADKLLEV